MSDFFYQNIDWPKPNPLNLPKTPSNILNNKTPKWVLITTISFLIIVIFISTVIYINKINYKDTKNNTSITDSSPEPTILISPPQDSDSQQILVQLNQIEDKLKPQTEFLPPKMDDQLKW